MELSADVADDDDKLLIIGRHLEQYHDPSGISGRGGVRQ